MEGFAAGGTAGRLPSVLFVGGFALTIVGVAWATWRRPAIRLWVSLLAVQATVVFLAPLFPHYVAWYAPTAALAIGLTADLVLERLRPRRWASQGAGAVFALAACVLVAASLARPMAQRVDAPDLVAALATVRCVTADLPVLLIETNTLSRDLASGCPLLLDPSGTSHDTDRGNRRVRDTQPEYQAAMVRYYTSGDAALFTRPTEDGLSASTWAAIAQALPVKLTFGQVTLLLRASP